MMKPGTAMKLWNINDKTRHNYEDLNGISKSSSAQISKYSYARHKLIRTMARHVYQFEARHIYQPRALHDLTEKESDKA